MTQANDSVELARFDALVRARRTNLRIDPNAPVDLGLVEHLCTLATWAPNHKRTWPWRFAIFSGAGREHLGAAIAQAMSDGGGFDQGKVDKNRTKYLRAPTVLAVASAHDSNPIVNAENRDAVAAGVQNLLLGATALRMASYWSSCHPSVSPAVGRLAGFSPGDTVVALIYLGWSIGDVAVPERPPAHVTRIDGSTNS